MRRKEDAIETLRNMVAYFDGCNETFNSRYDGLQLMVIYKAACAAEWGYSADTWDAEQVYMAIRGVVPQWLDEDKPLTYSEYAWRQTRDCDLF